MAIPKDILEEAIEMLRQSEMLKQTAMWQYEQIEKCLGNYTDAEFSELPWDEQQEFGRKSEELLGRMKVSINELKNLSDQYERLRIRLKEDYGDERLPPLRDNIDDLLGEDEDEEGEDWKKQS